MCLCVCKHLVHYIATLNINIQRRGKRLLKIFSFVPNQLIVLIIAKLGLEFALRINSTNYLQKVFGSVMPHLW